MATHSSILAWKVPWTEEPCGLKSTGLQRVRHDWATEHPPPSLFTPSGRQSGLSGLAGAGNAAWTISGAPPYPREPLSAPTLGFPPSLYLLCPAPAYGGSGGRASYLLPRDHPKGSLPYPCQLTDQSFLPQPLEGALPLQQGTGKWLNPYSPLLRLTLTVLLWKKGGFRFFFFFSFPSSALAPLSLGCLSRGPLWSGPGVCGQPFSIGSWWRVSPSGRAVWPYCAWWERGWPLEAPAGPLLYWLLLNWNT